jgi:DNA sulfur modification protein DndB
VESIPYLDGSENLTSTPRPVEAVMSTFGYVFPALRGVQAGREFYVTMCPLRLIPRIFTFDDDELRPELRAQRILNKSRVPEMAGYMLKHPKNYVFSALTASIDAKKVKFEPLGTAETERRIGQLSIPMEAKFIINDGQHRRAAIDSALRENPDLGDETIAVVLFLDVGLKRCQQMFADLNRYAIRTTTSLSILYDHRDEDALITKTLLQRVSVFTDLTEAQKSTISNRSIKLFTLSGIYHATQALMVGRIDIPLERRIDLASEFWNEVARRVPDWGLAKARKISTAELRRDYVHAHSLALAALARVGNALIFDHPKEWKSKLDPLTSLDWSRSNTKLWEGRAMNAGRVSKKSVNILLTASAIKMHLGLSLTEEEQTLENTIRGNRNGRS